MDKDGFVEIVAQKSGFTKGDVKVILDTMISVFTDCVKKGIEVRVRGFGHLYSQIIPARLGKDKVQLPETTRVIFKLAEGIRFADRD